MTKRVHDIMDATEGMSTKQAVAYLEHGAEMKGMLRYLHETGGICSEFDAKKVKEILNKLEGGSG